MIECMQLVCIYIVMYTPNMRCPYSRDDEMDSIVEVKVVMAMIPRLIETW